MASPSPSPSPSLSPSPLAATAQPTRAPVPTPSLKPGEFITWIKLDRPRFALGEILVSSFTIVGLVIVIAVTAGLILGHFKSKRKDAHGTGGLDLR
jgi:hypothetical protein